LSYAITLRLDPESERSVTDTWRALEASGISHDMLALGYAPHLTLAVLGGELPPALPDGARNLAPLPCRIGSVHRFVDTDILWLAADAGEALYRLHEEVASSLSTDLVWPHYRVGHWTPHITLQTSGDVERGAQLASETWRDMRAAQFVAIEVVRFPPVMILARQAFAPPGEQKKTPPEGMGGA